MDTRSRPRQSAPLLAWALVLGAISRGLSAWSAAVPPDTSSWESSNDTSSSLAVFAWIVAVPALVCAIVGVYRLACNVDRTALWGFEDRAPARTGYDSTEVVYATPPPPSSDTTPET